MSDKEILIQAFEQYVKNTASKLFGFKSIPSQILIKYVVANTTDKYSYLIDLFVNKNGNIDMNLITNAAKEELKQRGGFSISGIKFTESDIDELFNLFTELKKSTKA